MPWPRHRVIRCDGCLRWCERISPRAARDTSLVSARPVIGLPILLAMYRFPELNTQIRRALVAGGPGAAGELRKILRGEHVERLDVAIAAVAGKPAELGELKIEAALLRHYFAWAGMK